LLNISDWSVVETEI